MNNLEYLARCQRNQIKQQQAAYHPQLQQAQMMNVGIYAGLGLGAMSAGIKLNPFVDLQLKNKVSVSKKSSMDWDFDSYMLEIDEEMSCE